MATILLTFVLALSLQFWFTCFRFKDESPQPPDPIEIEARRLAEQEMDEFCSFFEIGLGITPAPKPKAFDDQIKQHLTTPVESYSDAHSAALVFKGNAKDMQTWKNYCMGCNEWTGNSIHTHLYNNYGEVVWTDVSVS